MSVLGASDTPPHPPSTLDRISGVWVARSTGHIRDTLVDHVEFRVHDPALRDGRFGQGIRRGRGRQSDRLAGSLLAPRMFLVRVLIINSLA